ncbi:hypothetical protein QFZ27_001641 [Inquilinus ginsengisoli]|uniref:hypothetical protein n=1 Tax=Inquilinus ginsengisoli TaxID=363840 RepID=UPI003D1BBAC3
MQQDHGNPERFLHDHADRLRRALGGGTPAAIAAAVIRLRDATASRPLRALLRP